MKKPAPPPEGAAHTQPSVLAFPSHTVLPFDILPQELLMTLESLFYLLGTIYFISGLIFLLGLLIVGIVVYMRIQRLKSEVTQSALVVGATKLVSSFTSARTLPFLSIAPIVLSGIKMIQQFRQRRDK